MINLMPRLILILALTMLTGQSTLASNDDTLKCVYTHTASATAPQTLSRRSEWFSRFKLPISDHRLAPKFCDDITVNLATERLYYLECFAADRTVRTDYELILDRKTGAVTNVMDIQQHSKTVVKKIHMGTCKLDEPLPPPHDATLTFPAIEIGHEFFTALPQAVRRFQEEAATWVTPAAIEECTEHAGHWVFEHLAFPLGCTSTSGGCSKFDASPGNFLELAISAGMPEATSHQWIEALLLGPLVPCTDCNSETTEYCSATTNAVLQNSGSFNAMVEAFNQHAAEHIGDGDLDLRYRSFGLMDEHPVYQAPHHTANVLTTVENELVVSLNNLPPTHPQRDPDRRAVSPWAGWHKVRTADGIVGYVNPDRDDVMTSALDPGVCLTLKDEQVVITRLLEAP